MSEYIVIETEAALAAEFRRLVVDGRFSSLFGVSIDWVEGLGSDGGIDVALGKLTRRFRVEFKLNPGKRDVERLSPLFSSEPLLLVTVRASSSLLSHCREHGVSCLDLNGYAWIQDRGILVSSLPWRPSRARYVTEDRSPNPFSRKSSRLLRALLASHDRVWKQADLAAETQLAAGLISRLLNHLAKVGWVEKERAAWRLVDRDALLDSWVEHDDWAARTTVKQYTTLERDLGKIASDLAGSLRDVAFTQWYAAYLRHPYTQPPLVSCYCRQFPSAKSIKEWGLSEVVTGGKVWLLVPEDLGVFQLSQTASDLRLVSDPQIYLDLVKQGLRGPEQAQALREWSGFCR